MNFKRPLFATLLLLASQIGATHNTQQALDTSVEWALNVGGEKFISQDGIVYQSDTQFTAESARISLIKGSQDSRVFKTYREGVKQIQQKIDNGVYTVILKFAEPQDIDIGERVFDVLIEGQREIQNVDIVLDRSGNSQSSVVRVVNNVEVNDGILDIELKASVGEPILNAIVVRKKAKVNHDWVMVWSDEFDYTGEPDPGKWTHNIWPAKKVNNEEQAYTNRLRNVRVEGGLLIIEAHYEDFDNANFTSGRIHSAGKGDMLYGRVEVRAKLPAGQGTWPAIWMLPTDPYRYAGNCPKDQDWQGNPNCDAWPNSGEIDIMEHVGYDMNRVHGTVHNRAYYWVNGEQRQSSIEAKNVDQEFHVYAMQWSPERIDIFYDNDLYFTYLNQGEGWRAWPYDHPFHLILNIAVGGGWGGAGGPTDTSVFPVKMEVDYVRLYQKHNQVSLIEK